MMQNSTPLAKYDETILRTATAKSESPPTSFDQTHRQDLSSGITTVEEIEEKHKSRFAYFKTKDFYIVLILGSV
jgi:hypothetical protein